VVSAKCATDPSKLGADPETKTNSHEIQFVKKEFKRFNGSLYYHAIFRRVLSKEEANLLKERIKSYGH
jgi:hypothetical protein